MTNEVTKQEKIEQGLLLLVLPTMLYAAEKPAKELVKSILQFQDENDVVIQVKRELPDNEAWHKSEREFEAYCAGKNELINAGCGFFEPLIKREK